MRERSKQPLCEIVDLAAIKHFEEALARLFAGNVGLYELVEHGPKNLAAFFSSFGGISTIVTFDHQGRLTAAVAEDSHTGFVIFAFIFHQAGVGIGWQGVRDEFPKIFKDGSALRTGLGKFSVPEFIEPCQKGDVFCVIVIHTRG